MLSVPSCTLRSLRILSLSLALKAMERVSLGSVKVAGILLVGLFIYDITWVYG